MKEEGKHYVDASKVSVAPIAKSIAKDMIIKKHYTHAWTACRYALGIYHTMDENDIFGNDQELVGVAVYGFPVGAKASTSVCEGLTKDNILELTRLYVDDGYGSNIESCALGKTFQWLKDNDKNIKVLLSYANNGQGHVGGIYKATNWIYQGLNTDIALMPNWGISLSNDPYDWIHSRTVFNNWGSGNLEHLRKEIGKQGYKEFWRREEPPKHRYIQILAQNKKEKKDLMKRLKHEIRPYPKDLNDLYLRSRSEGFGEEVKRRIMIGAYALSAGYYDAYYLKAQKVRQLISEDFKKAFNEVDLIMGPVSPSVAFKLGSVKDPVSMYLADIYTLSVNLAGLPGMSIPAGFSGNLPVGLQLIGNHWSEELLLNAAHQFQMRTDWHKHSPAES